MSSIRVFVTLLITALCLTASSFAQTSKGDKETSGTGNQVEVKTDRFSGNTTVRMKPQTLIDTPEHKLTMEMKYRLNQKEVETASFLVEEMASVIFESLTKGSSSFGDRQLHFLVDGKQLSIGETSLDPTPLVSNQDEKGRKPNFSYFSALSLSQVEEIAGGKKVEMRLGTIEVNLSPSTLAAIREFAREFANHAPTRSKKKGAKP